MKRTLLLPLLIVGLTAGLVLSASAGDGIHVERAIKMMIVTDAGESVSLDLGDMEVGDSETFYTDNNVPVWVTRNESNFEILVEGEDEALTVPAFDGDEFHLGDGEFDLDVLCEDEDDCDHNITIHKHVTDGDFEIAGLDEETRARVMAMIQDKLGDAGDEASIAFIAKDGDMQVLGDGEHAWTGADGETRVKVLKLNSGSPAQRLIESGALDGLDEAKRQEILDALGSGQTTVRKRIMIRTDEDQ